MEGLKLTRVIVLDDDEDEALKVIKDLWRRQIPTLYFSGVEDAPPENDRLTGVRLVFLDMDLVPATTDTKSKMSALVATLRRILSPQNGPYSVIAWTKHSELVEEFDKYVFQHADIAQPISIVPISKDECKDEADNFSLDKVKTAINEKLAEFTPLMFLQCWEAACLDAATNMTAELSKLAKPRSSASPEELRSTWTVQLLRMMNSMARAVAGRAVKDNQDFAFASFCSALSPLHADRLESQKPELCKKMSPHSPQLLSTQASQGADKSAVSRINTMLHCSYDRLNEFYAGNVYLVTEQNTFGKLFSSLNDFVAGFVGGKPGGEDWRHNLNLLRAEAIPIVLESNPTCDHSQRKVKIARLVAGLLIPVAEIEKQARPYNMPLNPSEAGWETRMITLVHKIAEWWHSVAGTSNPDARIPEYRFIKSADFLLEIGPLNLEIPNISEVNYYLVLNAQYVFSLPKNLAAKETAHFRLRNQAFANFQFWFGNHASRPGMLMVQ